MSDFDGEITKHSRVAPARAMRSTRYSDTARGRSTSPSCQLPTGRSSFENASGWMRLPVPAAGTIPNMVDTSGGCFDERAQLARAVVRGVLREHPRARGAADLLELGGRPRE